MLNNTPGIEILEHKSKHIEKPVPILIPIASFVIWALLWGFGFWYLPLWMNWWNGYATIVWVIMMAIFAFTTMLTCPISHPEEWTIRIHSDMPAAAWAEIQRKYNLKACTATDMWVCTTKEEI